MLVVVIIICMTVVISPIRARETKVMATFIAPIPRVADWLCAESVERVWNKICKIILLPPKPAFSKMEVE